MTTFSPSRSLPPSMALLLLASTTAAMPHVPHQTLMPTLPYRTLDVVPFPSPDPPFPEASLKPRQRRFNTVCGFIGGDPDIPATCWSGSHCVLDAVHSAVGCCPNGGPCTTGVFTGCVDFNSGAQTAVDPYVFTCGGGNVCYQNDFDGGYFQFGCGTASDLGTSVATKVDGTTLRLTTELIPLTETASQLETPTTLSSPTTSASSSSSESSSDSSSDSSSSSTSSSTSSTPSSSTSSSTSSPTDGATAAPEGDSGRDKTGAIIGGTLSGIAILVFLLAMSLYLWRRKKGNARQGPGLNTNTNYISPVSGPFAPLPGHDPNLYGTTTITRAGDPMGHPQQIPQLTLSQYQGAGPSISGGPVPPASQYSDTTPLTGEGDPADLPHTFNEALSRIGEEDEDMYNQGSTMSPVQPTRSSVVQPGADVDPVSPNVGGYGDPGAGTDESANSGSRPLWQQGRQQNRNQMWM